MKQLLKTHTSSIKYGWTLQVKHLAAWLRDPVFQDVSTVYRHLQLYPPLIYCQ